MYLGKAKGATKALMSFQLSIAFYITKSTNLSVKFSKNSLLPIVVKRLPYSGGLSGTCYKTEPERVSVL